MADEKKKRSYELRVTILNIMEDLAKAGTSRQKAIEAGITLLNQAPFLLRDLALRGDGRSVQAWFDRAEELIAKDTAIERLRQAAVEDEAAAAKTLAESPTGGARPGRRGKGKRQVG